jgi:hypothetical protein
VAPSELFPHFLIASIASSMPASTILAGRVDVLRNAAGMDALFPRVPILVFPQGIMAGRQWERLGVCRETPVSVGMS